MPGAHPKVFILALSLVFSAVLPGAYVLLLKQRGEIDRLFVRGRMGRLKPLRATAVACLFGWLALWAADAPLLIRGLMLCCASNAALAAVYTLRWRLSLHSVGAWGTQAGIIVVAGVSGAFFLPLTLAVSWSRVALGEHTPGEVAVGGLLGFSFTLLILSTLGVHGH